MREIYETLDQLRDKRKELEDWWNENQKSLSSEQQEVLFEWVIEDKFDFLPIVIGLTLDTADTADDLAANLERLSSHLNQDLAWGDFFTAFESKLGDNTELVRELYNELPAETNEWPRSYIGTVMAALPADELIEEILRLLRSRDADSVDVGVRGLGTGFNDKEVPPEIVEELVQLAEDSTFHGDVLRANMALFKANPKLWNLTLEIGRNHPTLLQGFINLYGRHIEREHLPEYVELLEIGLEKGTIDDLQIHHLYLDFADETEMLADFAVTLSDYQLSTAKQLAEQVAERNEEILSALFDRVDRFPSAFHGTEVVFGAGEKFPNQLVGLVIEQYDDSKRLAMLTLLKKAVGELFFASTYEKETAINIADFLTTIDDSGFTRPLKRDLIEDEPDDGEAHNKDVYHHLYGIISDHLDDRNYDQSTLGLLNEYPHLKSHFYSQLTRKIEQKTYHPMLGMLQHESHTYLNFLEENWERIPGPKQQQLLGDAVESTLSEIGFLLWLDDRGLKYDIDVNLHSYETGEELDKDVDVVVEGNYIEIRAPKTWRNLEVANRAIGIPNTAYNKIADKFKSDYTNSIELTEDPVFIALDITQSEIFPEDVISSLYGALKIQLTYDTETGQAVDDRPIRDPDESLQGWPLLDDNLNGVIWYTARLKEDSEGNPVLLVEGDVVPNPHHKDEDNFDYCQELKKEFFGDS